MVRIKRQRDRGRPFGPAPLFIDDCYRMDAIPLLSRSRGSRHDQTGADFGELTTSWTFRWTDHGREPSRTMTVVVVKTKQPLGGVRLWWLCPICRRRCRVLLVTEPEAPIGCRTCLRARYARDYPGRDRRRQFVALVHGLGDGSLGLQSEELDLLLAPKRRGVRRGRRVLRRTIRALAANHARLDRLVDTLAKGPL